MSKKSQNQRRLSDIHLLSKLAEQHYVNGDYDSLCALCDRVQDLRIQIATTQILEDVQDAWSVELGMRSIMVQSLVDNMRDTKRKLTEDITSYNHKEVIKRLQVIEENVESLVGIGQLMYTVKEEANKIRELIKESN